MATRWIAICSKPNKEEALYRKLKADEYEIFFPRCLSKSGSVNMLKVKPYFPGYLFVKVDLEVVGISTFQWMPFATDLVYCCGKPACVPDRLIAAIQRKLEHINRTTIASALDIDKIKPNDQTDYDEQEYENILDIRLSGKERVEALLQLIEQTGVVLN